MTAFNLGSLATEITVGTSQVIRAQAVVQNFSQNSIRALNLLNATLMQTNTLLGTLSTRMEGMAVAQQAVVTPVANVGKTVQKTAGNFATFGDTIRRVSMHLRSFGWLATTILTAPLLMAGKVSVQAYSDFEFSMMKIVGLVGVARNTVEEWSKSILAMGKEVGASPIALADALYYVTSSGFKTAEALYIVEESAKASAAGLGEVKDVADLVTSVMNAYGQANITAARTLDILTAAVREGKGEATQYAKVLGTVIPFAAQLGVSFDQVAGSVAAMTLQGASAANAATYLRNMFMKLIKPAKQSEDALNSMGTSTAELRTIIAGPGGLMKGLMKIRELTNMYGEDMMGLVIPNIRAMLFELMLTGKAFEYNQGVMKATAESAGDMAKAYQAVYNTVQNKMKRMNAELKEDLIKLGAIIKDALVPFLQNLVKALTDLVNWFSSLSKETQKTILAISGFLVLLGPGALILSVFGMGLSALLGFVNKLAAGFMFLRAAMLGTGTLFKSMPVWIGPIMKVVNSLGKALLPFLGLFAGVATVLGVVVPWLSNYQKKAADAAKANSVLEKTLIGVNGEVKKLADLSKADFGAMDQKQLLAQNTWYRQMTDYYDKKLVYLYQEAGVSEADYRKATKIMAEMKTSAGISQTAKERRWAERTLDVSTFFKTDYTYSIKTAQTEMDKFKELTAQSSEAYGDLYKSLQNKAIPNPLESVFNSKATWNLLMVQIKQIETLEAAYKALGIEGYDGAEKAKLFNANIQEYIKYTGISSVETQKLAKWISELAFKTSDAGKATNKFGEELKYIEMMSKALGKSYDVNSAKLDAYQQLLEDFTKGAADVKTTDLNKYAEVFFKGIPKDALSGVLPTDFLSGMKELVRLVNQYKDAVADQTMQKNIEFLKLQSEAFGGLGVQIEITNELLQGQERKLRSLANANQQGTKEWLVTVEAIKKYREAVIALEELRESTYFRDMAKATGHYDDKMNLLANTIDQMTSKLKRMSEQSQGSTEEFKNLALSVQHLKNQQVVLSTMTESLTNLFMIGKEGFEDFGEYIKAWAGTVLRAFQSILAEAVAKKIMSALFPASAALTTTTTSLAVAEAAKATAMAAALPVTIMATNAARQLAIAEAAAAAAWVPYPGNIAAIAGSITAAVSAMTAGAASAAAIGAVGLKRGGVVPPGYPNDTYPAMLSSKEMVIPPGKLPDLNQPSAIEIYGTVKVSGRELAIILRRTGIAN